MKKETEVMPKIALIFSIIVTLAFLCSASHAQENNSIMGSLADFREYTDESRTGYMIGMVDTSEGVCPGIPLRPMIAATASWGETLKLFDRITGLIEQKRPGYLAETLTRNAVFAFLYSKDVTTPYCKEVMGGVKS